MRNTLAIGAVVGALFGALVIWQGVADAIVVLLFASIGLLVGFVVLLARRFMEGDLDPGDVKSFVGTVINGTRR